MASQGCSCCKKNFMSGEGLDFSGFDRENWKPRNSSEHKRAAKRTLEETSPAAQQRLCSELGARYSVLQELEYFDCIRYFVVDPYHIPYRERLVPQLNGQVILLLTEGSSMLFETFPWHLPSALHFGKCALPSPPLPLPLCTLHLHTALKMFSHILKYCSCSRSCPVHRQPLLLQLTSKFPMMSSSAMLT